MIETAKSSPETAYHLPLPPISEHHAETNQQLAQHDHLALQDEDTIRGIADRLTIDHARILLDDLERTRAEHASRAMNAESAVHIIRDVLADAAKHNAETRSVVGSAAHTVRLSPKAAPTA